VSALPPTRELRERVDTAQVLTRFHYLARAVALACGGWIAGVPRLEDKALLARIAWEQTLAADSFRERVFELRYPARVLDDWADASFDSLIDSPDFLADLPLALEELTRRYADFLAHTDELDDGPTERIVDQAIRDTARQLAELDGTTGSWPDDRVPFRLAERPARDDRYAAHSFYWPDTIVPGYPYGEGVALQIRSAVSHLNEVWAVETAGAILHALAPELGWEWIRDAGRWTYDEARHMLMGKRRLESWGLAPGLTPLGGYIYEACAGQDPLYRLGMLGYFETKNIGRKRERADAFLALGDTTSANDMEFDWADETLHAEYGRRWLKELLERRGEDPDGWAQVLARCEELVAARLAQATDADREAIVTTASALLDEANRRLGPDV
jgi:uncharacterized ferritin-like protein (DUF455 family)